MSHSPIPPIKTEWYGDNLKVTAYIKHRKQVQWWFLSQREAVLVRQTFRAEKFTCWN